MRAALLVALGIASLAACGTDRSTAPAKSEAACGADTVVSLSVLHSAVLDCSHGSKVTLTGNSAHYLVVAELATGQATDAPVAVTVAVTTSSGGSRPPIAGMTTTAASRATSVERSFTESAPLRFHDWLRARGHHLSHGVVGAPPIEDAGGVSIPPLGSLRSFRVIGDVNGTRTDTSVARLAFAGSSVLIYVDTLSPAGGFTQPQLDTFGRLFDQVLLPLDIATFGSPTDIDHNGRVIMLLTPIVNSLTPRTQCSGGFTAGFFDELDLGAPRDARSNAGEIFYSMVPDPNGFAGCPILESDVEAFTPSVFLHEVQHMINFGLHFVIHGGAPESGWLDEGLSLVAEEQGARYYEHRFPPPAGRTDPRQIFPDSAEPFITFKLATSYEFLSSPGSFSLTLHSDADDGVEWRGGDWLLLRWLGDQHDSTIFARLDASQLVGTANLAAQAGETFCGPPVCCDSLFASGTANRREVLGVTTHPLWARSARSAPQSEVQGER